jgi:hypothetical protein
MIMLIIWSEHECICSTTTGTKYAVGDDNAVIAKYCDNNCNNNRDEGTSMNNNNNNSSNHDNSHNLVDMNMTAEYTTTGTTTISNRGIRGRRK